MRRFTYRVFRGAISPQKEHSDMAADTVNPQVTDAVTQTNVSVLGESPAQSMGMVYQSMAQSISLLMQNGVSNQGGMQQINAAVIATACREIMAGPQPKPQSPL